MTYRTAEEHSAEELSKAVAGFPNWKGVNPHIAVLLAGTCAESWEEVAALARSLALGFKMHEEGTLKRDP